jgi:hypothetical protein
MDKNIPAFLSKKLPVINKAKIDTIAEIKGENAIIEIKRKGKMTNNNLAFSTS